MAHELTFINDKASMAFVGETPWHGLGQALSPDSPLEVWSEEAGMNWECKEADLRYDLPPVLQGLPGAQSIVPDKKAIYRSDTFDHLAVVGNEFKLVQPREVLEFFRDLTEQQGFKLETAGVLFGGRKFWALARTGAETRIRGTDMVKGYLLLASACDGTLATTAQFTSIRVVCNNTLSMSLSQGGAGAIKIRHRSVFKPEEVKRDLGLEVFSQFEEQAQRLAEFPFDRRDKAAMKDFLVTVFEGDKDKELEAQPNKRAMIATFEQLVNSPGCDLPSARNTAWGAMNAVTRYVDFGRPGRGDNAASNRFNAGQFGTGAVIKARAWEYLTKLAA